jgi:hypothetical protein
MQFNNIYSGNNYRKYNNNSINLTFLKKGIVNNNLKNINNNSINTNTNSTNNNDDNNDNNNKQKLESSRSRWGPSTWYLFHTMAEKIKESEFNKLKDEILNVIKTICMNLPCPTCMQHATEYITRLNKNSIKNKEDLKIFLFNFHNDVNIRRNVSIFSLKELNDKYSNANTMNIIRHFVEIYQYKNKGFHMISSEIQRQRQLEYLKTWFNNNIQSFEI